MAGRRFRWGPLAAFAGLVGLGLLGLWFGLDRMAERSRTDRPEQRVSETPSAPRVEPPPPAVRLEPPPAVPAPSPQAAQPAQPADQTQATHQLPPPREPSFDPQALRVEPNGAVSLTSTADPGARVALVGNGVAMAEAVAGANGVFSLPPSPPLAPGTTEFRLRSTLPDGRSAISPGTLTVVIPRSTAESFTATLTVPGAPAREIARVDPRPVTAPDFSQVTVERDGRVTVRATIDPGARLALLADGREHASAAADNRGRVTLGPTEPLPAGASRLELRATHPDGRTVSSPDRLAVEIPRSTEEPFSVVREAPGEAPRTLARTEPVFAPPATPRFDVMRIEPDGTSVFSGSGAVPGTAFDLMLGDRSLGQASAGAGGEWSITPAEPLPPGRSELALRATRPDGRAAATSQERVIVEFPTVAGEPFAATLISAGAAPREIARGAATERPGIAAPAPPAPPPAPAAPAAPSPAPAAPTAPPDDPVAGSIPLPEIPLPPPPTADTIGPAPQAQAPTNPTPPPPGVVAQPPAAPPQPPPPQPAPPQATTGPVSAPPPAAAPAPAAPAPTAQPEPVPAPAPSPDAAARTLPPADAPPVGRAPDAQAPSPPRAEQPSAPVPASPPVVTAPSPPPAPSAAPPAPASPPIMTAPSAPPAPPPVTEPPASPPTAPMPPRAAVPSPPAAAPRQAPRIVADLPPPPRRRLPDHLIK